MRMRWVWGWTLLVVGCGGSAKWMPYSETAYPANKEAKRVDDVSSECEQIGAAKAEGDDAVIAIARTAAKHGGTHFVLGATKRNRTESSGAVVKIAPGVYATENESEVIEESTAKVYRCPSW